MVAADRSLAGRRRAQHVRMSLAPRRVGYLGEHVGEVLAGAIEAVVEAHRVEAMSIGPQVREHPNRAVRANAAGLALHLASHGVGERGPRIAEVVAAAKADEAGAPGDQPSAEQIRELIQVDVGQRDPMAELSAPRLEAPVANAALEDATGGRLGRTHSRAPNRSPTRTALATPSS